MRKLVQKVRDALGRDPGARRSSDTTSGPARDTVLLIGHSHVYALLRGYHAGRFPFELRVFDMLEAGNAVAIAAAPDGVVPALAKFLNADPDAPVLLSYGGNEHNLLALVEHPAPFDFHHEAGARIDPDRWLVPSGAMRAYFRPYVERLGQLMVGFRRVAPDRAAWLVLPPPPIPDADHIRSHPAVFAEKLATAGVAPYGVRHKLWLLQCELMRGFATEAGIAVLEVPGTVLDGAGKLIPQAWGVDAVHASPWYGGQVLQAFQAMKPSVPEAVA